MTPYYTIKSLLAYIKKNHSTIKYPDLFAFIVAEALLIGIRALHGEEDWVLEQIRDAVHDATAGKEFCIDDDYILGLRITEGELRMWIENQLQIDRDLQLHSRPIRNSIREWWGVTERE